MKTHGLSAEDHERVAEAVRRAEARTSGEIYCVVARASDGYFHAAALYLVLGIAAASLVLAILLDRWWVDMRAHHFVAAQALAIVCGMSLLAVLPGLRMHFVPRRHRYRRAHDNARKQFLARNVHRTSERTGVLVFVSLAERYAEVVADSGIDARVGQETWNTIVAQLVADAREDRLAQGFIGAVDAIGAILAQHFPVSTGDRNELDDHVVEI